MLIASTTSEERLRRLSVGGFPVNVSEQVMQPPLLKPRLESNLPQTQDPEKDLRCIARTLSFLQESGWYWGFMTPYEAKQLLQKMPEGTFLVRDSTHPSYLFTLSVKTIRDPANIRIEYVDGKFRLDTNSFSKPWVLVFPDVVSLIQHYVLSCTTESKGNALYLFPVFLSSPPKEMRAPAVYLKVIQPLSHKDVPPSLQHLCRLQINRCTGKTNQLPLPKRMKDYLKQYPFQL
ncbi:cytokine-inducible SH2-containing protein-like [Crotalus tigris]|uniref:cytokine-inducible SH2-containing protein-like n=1 Tax=Crotalus tigris TaxID=88082 RepID=UPI00192F9FBE|nr:cytokine-inducible SH2-containing protein-like [Crotalus tigris]